MDNEKQESPEVEAVAPAPRKRARIAKKEDHVYQANTDGQGERFDTEEQKKAASKATPAIFAVDPAALTPPRKNRGRPSKAYLQALEEYNKQMSLFQNLVEECQEQMPETSAPQVEESTETPVQEPAPEPSPVVSPASGETTDPGTTSAPAPGSASGDATNPSPVLGSATAKHSASETTIVVNDEFIILRDLPPMRYQWPQGTAPRTRRFTAERSVGVNNPDSRFDAPQRAATSDARESESNLDLTTFATGVLELEKDNSGFLRSADYNYLPSPDDVMVPVYMVRSLGLRNGDTIEGLVRMPRGSERNYVLTEVRRVNGLEARKARDRVPFESLTPLFPDEKFQLCAGGKASMSSRVVDLFAPIGKGQRALIVAQPKTGKTLLMKDVANSIARNHPDTYLIMLLVDERPEEVTDMARTVNAEVIASTFDEPASSHVRIANIVLEKAKRMVESGRDVVIFLDSITRLARAYNTVAPASGKILTGGVDANALQKPKRFFGAARNIEGGGSLTIIATALIETGSKMDEVIFEEFKGTGNMELQLERALANKRVFPAVNPLASSTRRDELLLDEFTQQRMLLVRNYVADMNPLEAMTFLLKRLENTLDNREFLATINK